MSLDRSFSSSLIVGIALAASSCWCRNSAIGLPPYFWVLIAFALFEAVDYVRGGGKGRDCDATRLIGFAIAIALMFLISMAAGIK